MSSPSIASTSSSHTNPLDHQTEEEKRSNIPYKHMDAFLKQRITLTGKRQGQIAQFSLTEMLTHMNIKEVILKGSSVNQWKNKTPPADIDLQCHLESSNIQVELADKFAEFLNKHSIKPFQGDRDAMRKTWLSKITYETQNAWSRLILNAGYLNSGSTKLDLCYTSQKQSLYDTLSASRTIHINTTQKNATLINKWSPLLVDWMKKNNLLWFKPNIENGLGRLSYRLQQHPNAYLLQPLLAAEFCKSASPETIQNVYMRILRDEYPNSQTSIQEKALLWTPVVDALLNQEPHVDIGLTESMKSWSRFNDLNRLKTALQTPESAEVLFNRLKTACSIGLNFKEELLGLLLKHHEALRVQLGPVIHKALGTQTLPAEQLFKILNSLNQLESCPKNELNTIFSECLQHYLEVGDDHTLQQSKNMLGWLHGDKLANCLFWLDRLPVNSRSNPSEQHTTQILESCLDLLASQGIADSLGAVLPQLSLVRLKKEKLHTLLETILHSETAGVQFNNNAPESICLSFIQILAEYSLILTNETLHTPSQETANKAFTQSFYKDIQKFCSRLKPQSIPPLLGNIISIKNKQIFIELPSTKLEISLTPPCLILDTGDMRKYLTNHLVGVIGPNLSPQKQQLNILWNDGCMFSGTTTSEMRNEQFHGAFSSPIKHPLPQGVKGLIDIARALCSTKFPEFSYDNHKITAKGIFHGNQLLKAHNIEDILKSLHLGEIHDESTVENCRLYHRIMNGSPVMCSIEIEEEQAKITSSLQLLYDKQIRTPSLPEFSNAWNLPIPEHLHVHQDIESSGGEQLIFKKPWNVKTRSFEGLGEVIGNKHKQSFQWKGTVRKGKLVPKGSLFVGNNKTPVLVLNSNDEQSTLTLPLISLLATWFTGEMNGQYSFKPNIWNQKHVWPPADFEGFIPEFSPTGTDIFSGYKTANGRAIGMWINDLDTLINNNKEDPYYSLNVGSFITQKTKPHEKAPAPLEATQNSTGILLNQNTKLIPHGLIRQTLINRKTYSTHIIDWMFFHGQSVSYSSISQNPIIRYNVPAANHHFLGKGYEDAGKRKDIDMVFNAKDGGADFMLVRPENHIHEPNHQSIYYDTNGLTQKILRISGKAKMADITFPSGIRYSGEIQERNHTIHLQGRFKLIIDQLKFQGVLDATPYTSIKNLQGIDKDSQQALDSIREMFGVDTLTLSGLISFTQGGQISYDTDIKPYLQIRTFTNTTGDSDVTEFSLDR